MKQNLRALLRNQRDSLNYKDRALFSMRISEHCYDLIQSIDNIRTIALYSPINSEVNVVELGKPLIDAGFIVALPSISPQMEFKVWNGLDLIDGRFSKEPPKDALECTPDCIIAPMLGFDKNGNRLGYGKGFYDQYISKLRDINHRCVIIGVAFSIQETPEIPCDSHDQKLDFIVTELGIIRC